MTLPFPPSAQIADFNWMLVLTDFLYPHGYIFSLLSRHLIFILVLITLLFCISHL